MAILATILLLYQFSPLMAASVTTLDDVQLRIQETEQKLQSLNEDIATNERLRAELQSALSQATSHVGERKERLQNLDTDISRYNNRLDKLDTQLKNASGDIQLRKDNLGNTINQLQNHGTHSQLKILLQHDNPALGQRLQIYSEYFLARQKQLIDSQVKYLTTLTASRETALKDRNWLNHIRKKADQQRENYEQTASQEQTRLSEVDQTIAEKHRSLSTLQADQSRLQSLMDELRKAQLTQSGYFESRKGGYALPVNGQLKARFGDVKSVGKLRWNGWFIQADRGTDVRAIADGEVVYGNWLEGFGMLAIVDHGDGYMSLYGGNHSITASIGDWVESGATIATVGDSGGQNTSGLYFEIRQNAEALDPKHWISKDANL